MIKAIETYLAMRRTAGFTLSNAEYLLRSFASFTTDLKQTVRALESSPTDRQRIGRHMLALATYLGHVNINSTYWYLETTPELLRGIAVVTENFVQGGQP
jgi:hypothetical protein